MTYLKRLHIFGVIFMALLVVTVFVSKSYAQSSFGLQNRWKTNEFIHIQNGSPQSSAIDQRWMSAQWIAEPVQGSRYVRLKNRSRPNSYLHIQNGPLQVGPAAFNWWSAHWQLEKLPGRGIYRLKNRWRQNVYIHNQNGRLAAGPAPANWWSSHWVARAVVRQAQTGADTISTDTAIDVAKSVYGTGEGFKDLRGAYRDQRAERNRPRRNALNNPNLVRPNTPNAGTKKRRFPKVGGRAKGYGKAAILQGVPTNVPFSQGLKPATYGGDICWKDSYGRGVGSVPQYCPPNRPDKDAGLCYPRCQSGYTDFVTMCVPSCPPGFRNDGLYCFKPKPVQRATFPWKLGDKAFSLDGPLARCRKSSLGRRNGCEMANANTIVYSKCPRGYKTAPVITSLCTPVCPRNTIDIGISCQKNTYDRGYGRIPDCGGRSPQKDAGLCYPRCKSGFNGIGPVCWANRCPSKYPVNCGASCAVSKDACALSVANQIIAPLDVVVNIAGLVLTGGAANAAKAAISTGAKSGAKAIAKAGTKAAVRAGIKARIRQRAKAMGKEMAESALDNAAETMYEAQQTGEFDFTSLDPTGVASVVAAYWKPLCADVK